MILVSVIIPLLNKEPYVKRAINSVLLQKYQNFEIIVVEGGSTDRSPDIVKSIPYFTFNPDNTTNKRSF